MADYGSRTLGTRPESPDLPVLKLKGAMPARGFADAGCSSDAAISGGCRGHREEAVTDDQRKELVRQILEELYNCKTRMTYSAVACLLDVPAQSVGDWLDDPRPEASWVVRKKDGKPSGYKESEWHPDLYAKPDVIKSCCKLRKILGVPLPREHRAGCEGGC